MLYGNAFLMRYTGIPYDSLSAAGCFYVGGTNLFSPALQSALQR